MNVVVILTVKNEPLWYKGAEMAARKRTSQVRLFYSIKMILLNFALIPYCNGLHLRTRIAELMSLDYSRLVM